MVFVYNKNQSINRFGRTIHIKAPKNTPDKPDRIGLVGTIGQSSSSINPVITNAPTIILNKTNIGLFGFCKL